MVDIATLGYAVDTSALAAAEGKLNQFRTANTNTAVAVKGTGVATDALAAAENRLVAVQNVATATTVRNTAAMETNRFAVANMAAQFNDIGVMMASGQSPMLLALQQGTQISQVLGPMGAAGAVRTLGAGFLAMINPVSLVTIATIALGAVGVQALMGIMGGTEDATDALEEHSKWLDTVLSGYDDVKKAAQDALEAATRLPQGVVRSDLTASLAELDQAATAMQSRISAQRASLEENLTFIRQMQDISILSGGNGEVGGDAQRQIDLLNQLSVSAASSRDELESAMEAARELFNTADDQAVRDLAEQVYGLARDLKTAKDEAYATATALAVLNNQAAQTSVNDAADKAIAAIDALKKLAPDLRTPFEKAQASLSEALANAPDAILRQAALQQYQDTIKALNDKEAQEDAKRMAREAETSAERQQKAYEGIVTSARQRISSAELEASVLGKTEEAANRLRITQEFLNQAANNNIVLTAEQRAELVGLANDISVTEEATRRLTEAYDFGRDITRGFFSDMRSGLIEGKDLWETFGNAALNVLDRLAQKATETFADNIWNAIFGAIGGSLGASSNPLGFLFGGGRAGGGPVQAGTAYRINENTPNSEYFIPGTSGTVVPANANGGGQSLDVHIYFDDSTGGFGAYVDGRAANVAVQVSQAAVAPVVKSMNSAARRQDARRYG